ncbi:CPBP family intramembrane metalloprotease [Niveibacterium umoris]|uniref:CAAX prenyl protease 2/Lysostaphin resistance protein A-like domain-containing protein n=1 Tax=Niveibacterium umoris TaxID=1193620 RepID=A0A840BIL3_9RHOO|nr:CPBP family intramembrane glutamic endopeptidase [Niveibacterium umoris]MBB4012174.1 hypothetical protein [Niveibacterium umoris]
MQPAALLALAVLAWWLPPLAGRWPLWPGLLVLASLAGLASGAMDSIGLGVTAALGGLVFVTRHAPQPGLRALALTGAAVLALAMALHVVPGFHAELVAHDLRLSADAAPFSFCWRLDTGIAGLLLIAAVATPARGADWRELGAVLLRGAPVIVGLVVAASLAAGYVRWAPKWPELAPVFLIANLCFTCVAEEAFFRGLIQARLQAAAAGRAGGQWAAIGVAALLFGLAHLGGGALYAAIATLAGVGYGWAFARSGRIEAAILMHFAVNAVHFIGFTYPRLAS